MRAPRFWFRPAGIGAAALWPMSLLYAAATKRRLKNGNWEELSVPVICVGNINVGGTGKTPTVIALLQMLAEMDVRAHVVSRGYGGTISEATRVDERDHQASEVGDEPLLIAAFGPCWVAKDRAAGAKAAIAAGAELILLDDGLQNPALKKDLSLAVVDAAVGFGNGCVLPAGPLREPLAAGLERTDIVLSIGDPSQQSAFSIDHPRWEAALQPLQTGMTWSGRYIAFAGIGRPEKFFATLKSLGADVVETYAFSDHVPYSQTVLNRLRKEARAKGAQLVSTEKDIVRMPASFRREVLALPVRLEFANPDEVRAKLETVLAAR